MIGIKLFEFQEKCSSHLVDYCNSENKKTIIVKSPTGSGKTIILLDFIDNFFKVKNKKICFVWLTPGAGELEEQSEKQMKKRLPHYSSKTIDDVLNGEFEDKNVCFINWERVTNKKNRAIMESERKNIFERIADAHRNQIEFILIIDEEHTHNTSKARDIINAFAPIYTIRVSATANKNKLYDYYEIDESDVIMSGLITKALYINEGIDETEIEDENQLLLNLAKNKRDAIKKEYEKINKRINPLVIIQFPDKSTDLISLIEEKLAKMDITYDNGKLAIWMSEEHKNTDDITDMDNYVQFLLIKQAIATGWDCPRAKILVKLRENMNETFELQTLGRLRRMPEAKHYKNTLLDNAYLYTFDEKYRESVVENIDRAYYVKRIFLKPEYYDFSLTKELRNLDFGGADEQKARNLLLDFYRDKYKFTEDENENRERLKIEGYNLSPKIERSIKKGIAYKTKDLVKDDFARHNVNYQVNTHEHGIDLRQSIDSMKSIVGLEYKKTRRVLEILFFKGAKAPNEYYKYLRLTKQEFYAFVINNAHNIREDFKEAVTTGYATQLPINFKAKEEIFTIPHEEVLKHIPQRDTEVLNKNVYREYTDDCHVEEVRSHSEMLFEKYCEESNNVKWFYKNGDTGQQYFSVVYMKGNKQHLFYADYIVKLNNGETWIIETKGGEGKGGKDKNIDIYVKDKFNAFKIYAKKHNLKWGFVRDKNDKLYINNTEYIKDMNDENWVLLKKVF